MRSRSLSTKLIFVFLFLAVAAYFSVQAYRYFVDPQTTTLVYAYSSEDAIAATGYFARDEQVIACSETLLELERAEGERVNAGGTLATVYRSESALNDHRQLRALRSRLEQLRYAREASRDAETALKLDGDIREDLFALRASLAAGSWTSVESAGEELRTTLAVVTDFHLRSGKELTSQELDALRAASERSRCRQRALRIIGTHFLIAGINVVAMSVYQAVGDPLYSLLSSVTRQLVVLLPLQKRRLLSMLY